MNTHVTLTILHGRLAGKQYVFHRPGNFLAGRADDCAIRLPDDLEYRKVSRHHCLLEVDPPSLRVRDLHSRAGTFLNGLRLVPKTRGEPCGSIDESFTPYDLYHGDTLRLGDVGLCVTVSGDSRSRELDRSSVRAGSRRKVSHC
jgi:eukaryotic-like serine/threonine-protein kinase